MKQTFILLIAVILHLSVPSYAIATTWHWQKGTIMVDTPARPSGQQPAIGLTCAPIPVVRAAFVGLGMRGPGAVKRWTYIPGTQVVALCDYEKERVESCQKILEKKGFPQAAAYWAEEG